MSNQTARRVWTFGRHSSVFDFASVPGTLRQLMPLSASLTSPRRAPLMRNAVRPDGKHVAPHEGVKMLDSVAMELLVRGPVGNTGAALVSSTSLELGDLLDTVLGDAIAPTGAATTVVSGNGALPQITVASGAGIADGMVIAFAATNPSTTMVRQVISGGGTATLTLDRVFTNTVTAGATVFRSLRWRVDSAAHELVHAYIRGETIGARAREYFGCMSGLTIDLPTGERAKASFSWQPTDIADFAEVNPAYTAPPAGIAVVTTQNQLFIGQETFMAVDLKLNYGGSVVARKANSGVNAIQGSTVQRAGSNPAPTITGRLYSGTSTTLGEVRDSVGAFNRNLAQGWGKAPGEESQTYDVAIQAGGVVGGLLYARAPVGVFTKFADTEIDGLEAIDFELSCFDPTIGFPLDLSLL